MKRRSGAGAAVAAAALVGGVAGAILGPAAGQGADAGPLAAYRGRSRVLVVVARDEQDGRLHAQRAALAGAGAALGERDLVVIEAIGPDARSRRLRDRLGVADAAFRAVLVGKDGGTKLSAPEPIPLTRLSATIDAMPMRRDEMRRASPR